MGEEMESEITQEAIRATIILALKKMETYTKVMQVTGVHKNTIYNWWHGRREPQLMKFLKFRKDIEKYEE